MFKSKKRGASLNLNTVIENKTKFSPQHQSQLHQSKWKIQTLLYKKNQCTFELVFLSSIGKGNYYWFIKLKVNFNPCCFFMIFCCFVLSWIFFFYCVWFFFLLDWFIRITSLVIKVWCLTETRVFGYKIPFPIQLYSIVSFYIAWWVDILNQRTTITMTNRIVVLLIKVMRCHEKLIIWFDYMKQNWRQLYTKIVSILLTYFLRT
jgi:hypothetical protein